MITLAIDTTMNGCSVCLYDTDSDSYLAENATSMSRGQAEALMPMINSALDDAGITYDDLGLIAVTKGPGAFTGMRIGLATAKALGLATDIPVHGVCTFKAVFKTYLEKDSCKEFPYYGVLLETKRQDYYFQLFDGATGHPCSDKAALDAVGIISLIGDRKTLILGDASGRFREEIIDGREYEFHDIEMPSALAIARLAGEGDNFNCDPVYLRAPEIGPPKNPPRKMKADK